MTDEYVNCTWPVLRLEAQHRFALEHIGDDDGTRIFERGERFVTYNSPPALALVQLGLAKVIDL